MTAPLLKIEDLRTYFYSKSKQAFIRSVDGGSLEVGKGQTLGVVGESGSGKSITALSVMGLLSAGPGVITGKIGFKSDRTQKNILQEADTITYATGREGVFAGGDLQTGPWIAIGAVAAGREAAESIVRYLDGHDMAEGRKPASNEHPVYRPIPEDEPRKNREPMSVLPVNERQGNFKEVELGYEETAGREEASRCLNCGFCCECYQCVAACGPHAVNP